MKRYIIFLLAVLFTLITIAGTRVWVYESNGNRTAIDKSKIDSVTLVAPGTISLSVKEKSLPYEGGSFDVRITASMAWKAEVSDRYNLMLSSYSGSGSAVITVTAASNQYDVPYEEQVIFTLTDGTVACLNVKVGNKLKVSPETYTTDWQGGKFTITVESNTSWFVRPLADWISVSPGVGTGNGSILVSIDASIDKGTSYIEIYTDNGESALVNVERTAKPEEPETLELSPLSADITQYGGNVDLDIMSNAKHWTIYSDVVWAVPSVITGSGSDVVSIAVAGNYSQYSDVANITVRTVGGLSKSVRINRDCEKISVTPITQSFESMGGAFKINVVSNANWSATPNVDWITISPSVGAGNSVITATVAEDFTFEDATGVITLATEFNKLLTEVNVTRSAKEETLKLSTAIQNVGYAGESFTFDINSNTSWFINNSQDWIIISTASGTGDQTITVTVLPNMSTTSDDATIVVTTAKGKAASLRIIRDCESIQVNTSSLSFTSVGGVLPIFIASNAKWSTTSSSDWFSLSKTTGQGNDTIYITVPEDTLFTAVTADISIETEQIKRQVLVNITRAAKDEIFTVYCNGSITNSIEMPYNGGDFTLDMYSNNRWSISADKDWVQFSQTSGNGNASIDVSVTENADVPDSSIVIFETPIGSKKEITVHRRYITDACGNRYRIVSIGNQIWMAENMRCADYDTASEAYKRGRRNAYVYVNASNVDTWRNTYGTYSYNLTPNQIAKLGYVYDWISAVGLDRSEGQRTVLAGKRQGICPNGWHIPSYNDWLALTDYIGGDNVAGIKVKSQSGWCYDGNGTDEYGFSALPTGASDDGLTVFSVGQFSNYWSATPNKSESEEAFTCDLINSENWFLLESNSKSYGRSVRCIKDTDAPVKSNMYLRGTINNWGVSEEYRFSTTDDIIYTLDKKFDLSGDFKFGDEGWTMACNYGSAGVSAFLGTFSIKHGYTDNISCDGAVFKVSKIVVNIENGTCTIYSEKCHASDYAQVTIGTQTWMAENYRCSKYDTESEAYQSGLLDISKSTGLLNTPYYTDAADKHRWTTSEYAGNLSNGQIAGLGYLYNWSAAVGLSDNDQQYTTSGNRQGVCPNGWHIPSKAEWDILANYLDGNKGQTIGAKMLQSTSGWYCSTKYPDGNGTDDFDFYALPSAYAEGVNVTGTGLSTHFWTSTPDENNSANAYYSYIDYRYAYLSIYAHHKRYGRSVRCLKDTDAPESGPTVSITGDSQLSCKITSTKLTATTDAVNASYLWSTGSTTKEIEVTEGGTYTVIITDLDNGRISESARFVVIKDMTDCDSDLCNGTKPVYSTDVTDACGNTYKTVQIGTQIWMAENMHCNQYSTNSDVDASIKGISISTTGGTGYAPCCTDGTAGGYGYYYNWAAVVGVADGTSQTAGFTGNRQGICPDGWHVPTIAEYNTLKTQIESADSKGVGKAGKYLKNETGWTAEDGIENLNCYGFVAMPTGYVYGANVYYTSYRTSFWTATPYDENSNLAYSMYLNNTSDALYDTGYGKNDRRSVRCLKN